MNTTMLTVLLSITSMATTGAANATANAIKASGAIIKLSPEEFARVLARTSAPVLVRAVYGMKKNKLKYLLSWKGFIFYCQATEEMMLPSGAEIISADKIWIPG